MHSFVAAGPFLGVDCHREERSLKDVRTGPVSGVFPARRPVCVSRSGEEVSLLPSANNMRSLFLKHFLLIQKEVFFFVKG